MPADNEKYLTAFDLDARKLWLTLVEQSAQTDMLRRQLDGMRGSLSWRITAPLRALRGAMSKYKEPRSYPCAGTLCTPPINGQLPSWMNSVRSQVADQRICWYIDVTELAREDLGAGVERVTRRLLGELILDPPAGVRIQPVRLGEENVYLAANGFLASFLGASCSDWASDDVVEPKEGDCFVGLDFCRGHGKSLRKALQVLKDRQVPIVLFVHDTLPLSQPNWFPPRVSEDFESWLQVASEMADCILCNSRCTSEALVEAMTVRGLKRPDLSVNFIPLGADFPLMPSARTVLPLKEKGIVRVLTVGTIEPRKGHEQALGAFEQLWREERPFHWIVAGRAGWNVDGLIKRMRNHSEFGCRFFWVDSPDDRTLVSLYRDCDVLLAPSLGEGYGLPVAEAGHFGLPLIVRDLPIFREIAGDGPSYFTGMESDMLANTLITWRESAKHVGDDEHYWGTWAQSAAALKNMDLQSLRQMGSGRKA